MTESKEVSLEGKSRSVEIRSGKGYGYRDRETGRVCMQRCFECGEENWVGCAPDGFCGWCLYDPNKMGDFDAEKRQTDC